MDTGHSTAELLAPYTTNADKIRALAHLGWKRADIARELGVRYQQVRNALQKKPGRTEADSPPTGPLRVQVTEGGRIVIPAAFRAALGIRVGDQVLLRLEEREIRLETPRDAIRRAQELIRKYVPQDDRSLVDELLAERRLEAERE